SMGELRRRPVLGLTEEAGGEGMVVAARELREARRQPRRVRRRRKAIGIAPRLLPRPGEPRFEAQAVGGERIQELPERSELLLETRPHVIQALRFGVAEVRTELALEPGTRGGHAPGGVDARLLRAVGGAGERRAQVGEPALEPALSH